MSQEQLDSLLRAYGGLLAENHDLAARLEAVTAAWDALLPNLMIVVLEDGREVAQLPLLDWARSCKLRTLAAGQTAPAADPAR